MKRKIALLLSVTIIMALVLTACGGNTAPSASSAAPDASSAAPTASNTAADGKQLVAQLGPNPETIDPALNSSVDGGNMLLFAYDCLLNIDKDEKIVAGAAEKWETSADGLTWTFHLRKDLKWSDGSPLTAKDFVYSWKRVADPATAAPYGETVLGMVKGYAEAAGGKPDALAVSAPDDLTFVVELGNPCPYFAQLAAFQTLSPVNQATIEKNGEAWATKPESYICNGPFFIKEWVPSSYILFAKNPNYWDAASIKLDSIKLLLIEDSNAAYAAYQTGEAMMIKYVPAAEIPTLKSNPEFHVDPSLSVAYVSLNDTLEQFSDPKVRQALSLAIDRKYLAETLLNGIHAPATGIVCDGITDWDATSFPGNANGGKGYIDSSDPAANLETAKKLLADAGYPEGKGFPAITYSTNDAGYNKTVAEYLQQAWQKLGITVKVDIVEWATFTPLRRAGDYIASRNGWGFDYNDPSNLLDLFMTTNGNNDGKYSSKDYDAMMKKAAAETDPKTRFGYLHQAEDILMNDMGCIPLTSRKEFYLQSPKITGSWYSPRSYWYFQYADIAE